MGLPEPIEPQSGDDAPEPKRAGRADWLCGPEEGLEAELQWREAAAPAPKLVRPGDAGRDDAPGPGGPALPVPKLARPSSPDAPDPHLTLVSGTAAPKLSRPAGAPAEEPEEPSPAVPAAEPTVLWQPAGNSVPLPPREAVPAVPPAPPLPVPAADLDFPMDDAEERALAKAEAAAAAAAAAASPSGPHAPAAARAHDVVAPEAFDLQDAPAPWWMQLPQLLREDRRVQGLAALVVVVLLAIAFWPRPEKSLPIGAIRRDAVRYDGQQVKIAGRVGEVFAVGGGHTFYLHQGRDTIVVFTRTRTPRRGDKVTLTGMVSTGYFNGQSGTAVFESATQ